MTVHPPGAFTGDELDVQNRLAIPVPMQPAGNGPTHVHPSESWSCRVTDGCGAGSSPDAGWHDLAADIGDRERMGHVVAGQSECGRRCRRDQDRDECNRRALHSTSTSAIPIGRRADDGSVAAANGGRVHNVVDTTAHRDKGHVRRRTATYHPQNRLRSRPHRFRESQARRRTGQPAGDAGHSSGSARRFERAAICLRRMGRRSVRRC